MTKRTINKKAAKVKLDCGLPKIQITSIARNEIALKVLAAKAPERINWHGPLQPFNYFGTMS